MRGLLLLSMLFALDAFAEPVPYAPTAADAVPAAILGKGPALLGTSVAYFTADPKAQGYLAVPAGTGKHGAACLGK